MSVESKKGEYEVTNTKTGYKEAMIIPCPFPS